MATQADVGSERLAMQQALANWSQRLREFSLNPQPNYTVDGNSYQMADYGRMCSEMVVFCRQQVALLDDSFEIVSGVE